MQHVEVEYAGVTTEHMEAYYDTLASSPRGHRFLSPVLWPSWMDNAVRWMCSGSIVGELGCGQGEFAEQCVLRSNTAIRTYYLLDVSQRMLERAWARLTQRRSAIRIRCIKANLALELPRLGQDMFDRVIAINVFQDVEAMPVLRHLQQLLRPGGELRATFIWRDAQNVICADDDNYDEEKGFLYAYSRIHQEAGIAPVGYVLAGGQRKPFYRLQRYFTPADVTTLLQETGFALRSLETLIYPTEIVTTYGYLGSQQVPPTDRQRKLIEQWGGLPDALDVVAQRL